MQANDINQKSADPRLKDSAVKKTAVKDAAADGISDKFPAFKAQLRQYAQICSEQKAAYVVRQFRQWAEDVQEKIQEMTGKMGEVKGSLAFFVQNLDEKTNTNLKNAHTRYADQIAALFQEKGAWKTRFGSALAANTEPTPKKSAVFLGGLALFLVAVESALNSQFFAVGSEFGLTGGILFAIAVSLGNVLIPLALGFLSHHWFYSHDSNRGRKISNHALGMMTIVTFLLLTCVFNIFVAEYRESLSEENLSEQNFPVLHYFLLFALGAAVSGLSFWKAWSFRDPFEKARKCLNDFQRAQENYKTDALASLTKERAAFSDIRTKINQWDAEFPAKFQNTATDFNYAHGKAIDLTKQVFATYHALYQKVKVAPAPDFPAITPDVEQQYGAGVTKNEWELLEEKKNSLNDWLENVRQEWIPIIQESIEKISELEDKFEKAIAARLAELTE